MIEEISEIAIKAGHAILEYYKEDVIVERKDDNSPLTKADMAAHYIITDSLKKLTPDIPIISEEGGVADFDVRKKWERFWLVDPLDGTKEFIKKNDEFTVNIALIENGNPVIGVVYIPAKDILYAGHKENGSYKKVNKSDWIRIYSKKPDLSKPVTVVASRSHGSDDLDEKLTEKGVKIGSKIPAGSSLKFCLVAEGSADIYPRMGPTMEWDTAAGDAVY
ncbi:MAG: 3'(2'),5'-bisphosphate nucleotidase CysQ, partial [Balneolaceae bacterium]